MPNMNAEVNILDYSNEQAILIPESMFLKIQKTESLYSL